MISMIAAVYKDNGIGYDNQLLAHIKEDLQNFKKITQGHIIIMGYNTFLSLPKKKPLPNRINVVLTSKDIEIDDCMVVHSIEECLEFIKQNKEREVFIIGGASVYKQFMPYAQRLYITHVFDGIKADTFFPEINETWKIMEISGQKENIHHKHPHIFAVYEKETENERI